MGLEAKFAPKGDEAKGVDNSEGVLSATMENSSAEERAARAWYGLRAGAAADGLAIGAAAAGGVRVRKRGVGLVGAVIEAGVSVEGTAALLALFMPAINERSDKFMGNRVWLNP